MTKKKPAFQKRLNHIRVTVWRNSSEKAKDANSAWFSTEVKRRYADGQDWFDSFSLNGVADITLAIEGLTQARDFIREREASAEAVNTNGNEDE